jgi:hypothetical protein
MQKAFCGFRNRMNYIHAVETAIKGKVWVVKPNL